jgi:mannose-6-phosphate isomerase-like protein (cupin superfamily)
MAVLKNLSQQATNNSNFRKVVATQRHVQVVVMSIKPGEDIGSEIHPDNDQLLYLVAGSGTVALDGEESDFEVGDAVVVPAGVRHNFTTKGDEAMKIITTYSPAHHPEGTIHATKADAEAAEAHEHE